MGQTRNSKIIFRTTELKPTPIRISVYFQLNQIDVTNWTDRLQMPKVGNQWRSTVPKKTKLANPDLSDHKNPVPITVD